MKKAFLIICATIGLIICLLIIWKAISLFFLIFAGILLAIFLEGVSSWIERHIHWPYPLILTLVILSIIVILGSILTISTPLISEQLTQLFEKLPSAYEAVQKLIGNNIDLKFLSDKTFLKELVFKSTSIVEHAGEIFTFTVGTIISFVIFIFIGLYISFNPKQYVRGLLLLVPPKFRDQIAFVLYRIGYAMRWWLVGKFVAMTAIGILTTVGLWILNVPLAFILGLLAGLFTFIPYVGAILTSIPAILIAYSVNPWKAFYVLILYLGIHAIEGYGITPVIEQRTVSLAPALTITVQIILSLLVGFIGLALASPITAVVTIFIQELYINRQRQIA